MESSRRPVHYRPPHTERSNLAGADPGGVRRGKAAPLRGNFDGRHFDVWGSDLKTETRPRKIDEDGPSD